jgi:hypothetical protein
MNWRLGTRKKNSAARTRSSVLQSARSPRVRVPAMCHCPDSTGVPTTARSVMSRFVIVSVDLIGLAAYADPGSQRGVER